MRNEHLVRLLPRLKRNMDPRDINAGSVAKRQVSVGFQQIGRMDRM